MEGILWTKMNTGWKIPAVFRMRLSGCTDRFLTEEEEERRMEKFKKATADFLMAVSREREQQACQQTENCV